MVNKCGPKLDPWGTPIGKGTYNSFPNELIGDV